MEESIKENLNFRHMLRVDSGLNIKKNKFEKTKGGIYRVFATIGKVHHELPYLNWDGRDFSERVEVINSEELFKEDSLLTAFGMPVLLGHTKDGYFRLNQDGLQVGSTLQEYRENREEGELDILLAIHDKRGIKLIDEELERGRIPEISPTYALKGLQQRSDGKFWQVGRIYDNFALLKKGEGRGGSAIALRFDSKDDVPQGLGISKYYFSDSIKKGEKVADLVLRIDGKDEVFRDVDENLHREVTGLIKRSDSLGAENENLKSQVSTLTAQLDATKLKLSETEESLTSANNQRMDDNAIALELERRGEVWDLVEPFLIEEAQKNGKQFRRDNRLNASEIKKVYLKLKAPHLNLDGKDDSYIAALWDALAPQPGDKPKPQEQTSRVDSLYEWLTGNDNQGGVNQGLNTDSKPGARDNYIQRIESGTLQS